MLNITIISLYFLCQRVLGASPELLESPLVQKAVAEMMEVRQAIEATSQRVGLMWSSPRRSLGSSVEAQRVSLEGVGGRADSRPLPMRLHAHSTSRGVGPEEEAAALSPRW